MYVKIDIDVGTFVQAEKFGQPNSNNKSFGKGCVDARASDTFMEKYSSQETCLLYLILAFLLLAALLLATLLTRRRERSMN